MGRCSAWNCKSDSRVIDKLRLFRYPANPARCKQWLVNSRKEWTPWLKLCQAHFEESQFEQHRKDNWKKLKTTAIPTIFNFDTPSCRYGPRVWKSGKREQLNKSNEKLVSIKLEAPQSPSAPTETFGLACGDTLSKDDACSPQRRSKRLRKDTNQSPPDTPTNTAVKASKPTTIFTIRNPRRSVDTTCAGQRGIPPRGSTNCSTRFGATSARLDTSNDENTCDVEYEEVSLAELDSFVLNAPRTTYIYTSASELVLGACDENPAELAVLSPINSVIMEPAAHKTTCLWHRTTIKNQRLEIRRIQRQNRELRDQLEVLKKRLSCLFNEDQLESLHCSKMPQWSDATVVTATEIHTVCGTRGYEYLRTLGYPLPAIRTLHQQHTIAQTMQTNT